MFDNAFAYSLAQGLVDRAQLNRCVFSILRFDRLSGFFDQSAQLRFGFDVARPSLEALLMPFDDRCVNRQ